MSFQAYLDAVELKTGKTPQDLIDEAKAKNLKVHKDIITWLKTDYQLGHGHTNAIAHIIKNGPKISDKHVGSTGTHRDESDTLKLTGNT